ncbi:hypothetical protein H0B56_21510 [Haloechinothrix sp. YIM 98757]|uniref:Lipoprotein n=1 Tax=Haloechinothrix aidingensis TaxID=2752311 RepID=A0A838AFZ9_9PSEU|nr:hypothetical protein [Haloechinothrix aidingensis]MBA0128131.1 hypothetical protein [Haloechinothrix aidingensis]
MRLDRRCLRYAVSALAPAVLVLGACTDTIAGSAAPVTFDGAELVEMLAGTWQGEYTCPQGQQGMTLVIDGGSQGDGQGRLVVEFFELSHNPGVAEGSFLARVTVDEDGTVEFTPERWIERPDGYAMTPLVISDAIARGTTRLRGDVDSPGCGEFVVEKQ